MKAACLAAEVRYFEAHPNTALAYCAYDGIDDFGRLRSKRADIQKAYVVSPQVASEIMFYHGDISGNIANVTIRRSILERSGLFREDMKVSGDFELLVRLAGEYSFCEIHEPLIYLRTHKRQFSVQRGVFPLHMRENAEIYATLITRMTHIDREYALRYHRYARHVRYFHYAVRSAMLGDWQQARAAFDQVKQQSNLPRTILGYIISGNVFACITRSRIILTHLSHISNMHSQNSLNSQCAITTKNNRRVLFSDVRSSFSVELRIAFTAMKVIGNYWTSFPI